MVNDNTLRILRNLLSELRYVSSSTCIRESPMADYILKQYRKYQVTDLQLCKAQEEMLHLAQTYLTYLQSQRKYDEIYANYHAKGERTVKQTADMVGFKLPQDPK